MEPVSWLKVASNKLKKPGGRQRFNFYNFSAITKVNLSLVSQSQSRPLPYQQTHARTWLCGSPNLTYQLKSFTTTSLPLAYKKVSACVFVFVRALGLLRLNLTFPMATRAVVHRALFVAQVSGVQRLF